MVETKAEREKRKSDALKLSLGGSDRSSYISSQASSPQTPGSPSLQNFPEFSSQGSSPVLSDISVDSTQKKPRTNKKAQCPCGKSSGGQSWNITCHTCKQVWHNACVGLKADFTKPVINSLTKSWQCPWCFCCPFPRPPNHVSLKNAKELGDRVLTTDFIQQITESVADVMKQSAAPLSIDITGIQSQLDTLSQNIQELRESRLQPPHPQPECPLTDDTSAESNGFNLECNEKPISDSKTDYLAAEQEEPLKQLLKTLKEKKLFKNKNGRSTISYGEHYSYSGSADKPTSKEIPPAIKEIIGKIKEDYNLNNSQIPNSVLINHFPPKVNAQGARSSLPKHSDDEIEIEPDSSIFTYSVGGPRNIVFSANFTDDTEVYEAKPNSLYVMTRKSQAWHKHEIIDAEVCEERFSVTLRCINTCNQRSMLIIGDSNTKEIKFGSGVGTVGEKYPGKRVKAAKIHQIDPRDCVGYSNIVISCGTNNLRPSEITGQRNTYIKNLVDVLQSKIENINVLTPTKIFIMPVPPSRDQMMNKNIIAFNNLLFESEFITRYNIWMPGMYSFLDRSGMLNSNLTRGGDQIHFGDKGICMFVRLIKDTVYQRERAESRGPWKHDTSNHTSGSRRPP